MTRKTKIVATVGAQRSEFDENPVHELGRFDEDGTLPRSRQLRRLIEAGANIIRINMSFATRSDPYGENERQYLLWLKENAGGLAKHVAVLGDLPGPKIRLGKVSFAGNLSKGDAFYLSFGDATPNAPGAQVLVNQRPFSQSVTTINECTSIGQFLQAAQEQVTLTLADGKAELHAREELDNGIVRCEVSSEVFANEHVTEGKGLTIKDATLGVDAFQEGDQKALEFLLEHAGPMLAYVAVSFAQSKADILHVRYFIERHRLMRNYLDSLKNENPHASVRAVSPGIIAKIETRKALSNIDEILDVADGVMVARGDLGEQLPPEEVPRAQKEIIRKCNVRGKPVITATQMLDSMEKKPSPTRAEATDVFNAILDGSDAVMLSGETSSGSYPASSVAKMAQIAEQAERYYFERHARSRSREDVLEESRSQVDDNTARLDAERRIQERASTDAPAEARLWHEWVAGLYREKVGRSRKQATTDRICEAACKLSEAGDYKGISVATTSGRTAFMISRFRPIVAIIAGVHYERTFRKLLLSFGVTPVLMEPGLGDVDAVLRDAVAKARSAGLLEQGDEIVATSGSPLYVAGTTNLIQVLRVK